MAALGCGGSSSDSGSGSGESLTLVAYSTPEEAYRELIPAFNKSPEGEGVAFDQSYAASGEQSRAVATRAFAVAIRLRPCEEHETD